MQHEAHAHHPQHGHEGHQHHQADHTQHADHDPHAGHDMHARHDEHAGHDDHAAHGHHAHHQPGGTVSWSMAAQATLHCLTGCAIGEVLGMIIGTALGWSNMPTMILAIVLAFFFGYALTLRGIPGTHTVLRERLAALPQQGLVMGHDLPANASVLKEAAARLGVV